MTKPFIPIGRALCHTDHELTRLYMEFWPDFFDKKAQGSSLAPPRGSNQSIVFSIYGYDQDA
nr:hypothetical protein [Tanacetum cinerariifolium]